MRLLSFRAHHVLALLIAFGSLANSGCTTYIAHMVACAPNQGNPFVGTLADWEPARAAMGIDQQFQVQVGPPKAELAVSIIEPDNLPPGAAPKGTVLVLHGLGSKSMWMLDAAHEISDAGYRSVVVDLRGQGGSTGKWLSFGVRESVDLSQLLDELETRNLIAGRIGVYGISYGASTAIQLAAIDRRVSAVVAISPFSSLRTIAPHYFRTFAPGFGHMLSETTYKEGVEAAAARAGFHPDDANAALAITMTNAPVLLMHGTADMVVPIENSERIHQAAPRHSHFIPISGAGHMSIWLDFTGQVQRHTLDWLDRYIAPYPIATAPAPALPAQASSQLHRLPVMR